MSESNHSIDNGDSDRFVTRRHRMVEKQIRQRGIRDERVLQAMESVPREAFVNPGFRESAYEDRPLPIGSGQTISQPYIVAAMCAQASPHPNDRALEIGTGCGYAAAVLSKLCREVHTVERVDKLYREASHRLAELDYKNVYVHRADDRIGLPDLAPFDVILVAAAAETFPEELADQLGEGGRLIIPLGGARMNQMLCRFTKRAGELKREDLFPVAFVPLVNDAAN
jgi:protein-L-isoaspartate(D-aspartate) O-methyltransferase